MTNAFPEDYGQFSCLAGRCAHTCCAGWEIDIDPASLAEYRALTGPLGERLRAAIEEEPTPHFRLETGDVCPFLRADGLCDLILEGGEALLCQICRDHPRWRSFLPGYTETGLGLCCEAAAAQALARRTPPRMVPDGPGPDDPDAAALLETRDALLVLAFDRGMTLEERLDAVPAACRTRLPERSPSAWAAFFRGLERMDEAWTSWLDMLDRCGDEVDIIPFLAYMGERQGEYEQLLGYFLTRHVPRAWEDLDLGSKAAFAVLSTRLLLTLGALQWAQNGRFTFADQTELVRLYSAEIEYSEDNLAALYEALSGDGEA